MKRFGSLFPFLEHGAAHLHIGRLVANHDFLRALLRFGTFDEYVLANPSSGNRQALASAMESWGLPADRLARVRQLSYPEWADTLGRDRYHVVHVGGWGWFMPGLHYLRAARAATPWPITGVTFSLHGREMVDHAVRMAHAQLAPCDAVFCISRDGREAMRRLLAGAGRIAGRDYAGQLLHLPLGIDDDLFGAAGDGARARARLRIPADAVVLLTLGRITPSQKMDLGPWLRAFAHGVRPRATRPVVVLLAGGASPADLALVRDTVGRLGIADLVRVHPNFPADQKPDLLAAADVLVSPVDNTQETFGLSLVEAHAAGLPVVASRYDGYKDLVEDGVDGYLVDTVGLPGDPAAEWFDVLEGGIAQLVQSQTVAIDLPQLVDRVVELVDQPERRRAMGARGRDAAGAYRFSRVIARWEAAWDELAARAARDGVPAAGPNPWNVDPGQVFGHYPSHVLEDRDRVVAAAPEADEALYADVAPWLPREVRARVFDLARTPATVGELIAQVGASPEVTRFAVVWLLKYGLLARAR
jgi:glycosyltransferase involved in cell wall biosynthesis